MSNTHPQGEFELIRDYFQRQSLQRADVHMGIGDDGAVVSVPVDKQLVLVMDTMVAGIHFPLQTSAYDLGWKSLAVNLSDLAAMGAEPAWLTLALTLPHSDAEWVKTFSLGLFALASAYNIQLIGGDTTRGPLSITVQAHGLVEKGGALLRSGAEVGDLIYVSGFPGEAALGLILLQSNLQHHPSYEHLLARLNRPEPRLGLGRSLHDIASACIDISDGLLADLQHILDASGVGAEVLIDGLPLSEDYRAAVDDKQLYRAALSGGDDYELLFTVPKTKQAEIDKIAEDSKCLLTCIGEITEGNTIRCLDAQGNEYTPEHLGFEHFAE
ncbi:MAG: thiamine-phosphate kinase [Gammaproteobacteria bacterium]|nr:thiamine-phosphate kinase [Gammaproteobacteria bacterium]